jgi:hypothetical protein
MDGGSSCYTTVTMTFESNPESCVISVLSYPTAGRWELEWTYSRDSGLRGGGGGSYGGTAQRAAGHAID